MTTNSDTLTASDLYAQLADWEGAPPAYICTYPIGDLTATVMDFTLDGLALADAGVWISVDLFELQRIAAEDARAFGITTGENPW